MEFQQLRPWQQDAVEKIRDQGNTELMWIFDFKGNSGKTTLSQHLASFEGFQRLPQCKCSATHTF